MFDILPTPSNKFSIFALYKDTTIISQRKIVMNKKRTSYCLHPDAIEKLKIMAEKENRSHANMLEILIIKAYQSLPKPTDKPS
jgi:hypothetical protein